VVGNYVPGNLPLVEPVVRVILLPVNFGTNATRQNMLMTIPVGGI